jgi:hypothetical protein
MLFGCPSCPKSHSKILGGTKFVFFLAKVPPSLTPKILGGSKFDFVLLAMVPPSPTPKTLGGSKFDFVLLAKVPQVSHPNPWNRSGERCMVQNVNVCLLNTMKCGAVALTCVELWTLCMPRACGIAYYAANSGL